MNQFMKTEVKATKNSITVDGIKYVNLTSHPINDVYSGIEIPSSGREARAQFDSDIIEDMGPLSIRKMKVKCILGLPEPKENTVYIVASVVLTHVENRTDVIAPGPATRDGRGQVIGCKGFRA